MTRPKLARRPKVLCRGYQKVNFDVFAVSFASSRPGARVAAREPSSGAGRVYREFASNPWHDEVVQSDPSQGCWQRRPLDCESDQGLTRLKAKSKPVGRGRSEPSDECQGYSFVEIRLQSGRRIVDESVGLLILIRLPDWRENVVVEQCHIVDDRLCGGRPIGRLHYQ